MEAIKTKIRMWKHKQHEWNIGHPITTTKKNKTGKVMVNIHGIISLFLCYPKYLQRLGKI